MEKKVGPYHFTRKLNHSEFGETFLAQKWVGGYFASDVIVKSQSLDKEAQTHLINQARLLCQLNHPNLVKILDFFTLGTQSYTVYEYIPGWDLQDFLSENRVPITPEESICLFLTVLNHTLEAVQYLSYKGIVHGDIHPCNIRINPHLETKLIDYGTTQKCTDNHSNLSAIGARTEWSPPEKLSTQNESPTSDYYAIAKLTLFFFERIEVLQALKILNPIALVAKQVLSSSPKERKELWDSLSPLIHKYYAESHAKSGMTLKQKMQGAWRSHQEPAPTTALMKSHAPVHKKNKPLFIWLSLLAALLLIPSVIPKQPKVSNPISEKINYARTPIKSKPIKPKPKKKAIVLKRAPVKIFIQAKPWAKISINGIQKGTTPLVTTLPALKFPLKVTASYNDTLKNQVLLLPKSKNKKPIKVKFDFLK